MEPDPSLRVFQNELIFDIILNHVHYRDLPSLRATNWLFYYAVEKRFQENYRMLVTSEVGRNCFDFCGNFVYPKNNVSCEGLIALSTKKSVTGLSSFHLNLDYSHALVNKFVHLFGAYIKELVLEKVQKHHYSILREWFKGPLRCVSKLTLKKIIPHRTETIFPTEFENPLHHLGITEVTFDDTGLEGKYYFRNVLTPEFICDLIEKCPMLYGLGILSHALQKVDMFVDNGSHGNRILDLTVIKPLQYLSFTQVCLPLPNNKQKFPLKRLHIEEISHEDILFLEGYKDLQQLYIDEINVIDNTKPLTLAEDYTMLTKVSLPFCFSLSVFEKLKHLHELKLNIPVNANLQEMLREPVNCLNQVDVLTLSSWIYANCEVRLVLQHFKKLTELNITNLPYDQVPDVWQMPSKVLRLKLVIYVPDLTFRYYQFQEIFENGIQEPPRGSITNQHSLQDLQFNMVLKVVPKTMLFLPKILPRLKYFEGVAQLPLLRYRFSFKMGYRTQHSKPEHTWINESQISF